MQVTEHFSTTDNWQDRCDLCAKEVGEDQLVCDEEGIAACADCEPDLKYSHAIDIAAEVENNSPDTVTANEARQALLSRINRLSDLELLEAIDIWDTSTVD